MFTVTTSVENTDEGIGKWEPLDQIGSAEDIILQLRTSAVIADEVNATSDSLDQIWSAEEVHLIYVGHRH